MLGRKRPRNSVVISASLVLKRAEWTHLTLYHESKKTLYEMVNSVLGTNRILIPGFHDYQVYFPPNPELQTRLIEACRRPDKEIMVRTGGENSPKVGLNLNTQLAGIPYWVIRDLLRKAECLDQEDVGHLTGLNEGRAAEIFQAMIDDGLLELGDADEYVPTPRGKSLGDGKLMKRIPRTRAENLVADLLERAERINANGDLVYYVKSVALFGSILDPAVGDLGDVDVRLETAERPGIGCTTTASVTRGRESGKDLSFFASLTYGTREVQLALKNGSPYISLHGVDEVDRLGCLTKLVFEAGAVAEAARFYETRS
jgi:hypothetical protein